MDSSGKVSAPLGASTQARTWVRKHDYNNKNLGHYFSFCILWPQNETRDGSRLLCMGWVGGGHAFFPHWKSVRKEKQNKML